MQNTAGSFQVPRLALVDFSLYKSLIFGRNTRIVVPLCYCNIFNDFLYIVFCAAIPVKILEATQDRKVYFGDSTIFEVKISRENVIGKWLHNGRPIKPQRR